MSNPAAQDQSQAGLSQEGVIERDYHLVVAWLVILVLIVVALRTKLGYVIVYYSLWLMIAFVIVTNAQFFSWALAPFQKLTPNLTFADGAQAGPSSGG